METTLFLSQAFGVYLLVMGLAVLFGTIDLSKFVTEYLKNTGLFVVTNLFVLVLGILLVLSHNVWNGTPETTLISLICWLVFIKGVVAILLPSPMTSMAKSMNNPSWFKFAGVLYLVLGLYLGYVGFFM